MVSGLLPIGPAGLVPANCDELATTLSNTHQVQLPRAAGQLHHEVASPPLSETRIS